MSSLPQVSVVIPAYNASQTLGQTLDSVLAQTVAPGEVIVVDDGSKDETCDVVRSYGDRVRLIQQANAGPAAARNHGIRESKFDWIALLDSDDTWFPEKLEVQLPHCRPDVGIIHAYEARDFNDSGDELTFEALWSHNYIGTSTVVLNKRIFDEVGGFVEDRAFIGAEDYNLWLRISATGSRIVMVKRPLINYTPAEGNLSSNYERVIKAELLNVDTLASQLKLPREMVNKKRAALYAEYGKALFWKRKLHLARGCYSYLLRHQPSLRYLGYWAATFLPESVLNMRRPATAS